MAGDSAPELSIERIADPALRARVQQAQAAGRVAGPYVLLEQLGKGGMGTVLRAWDARHGRLVALKALTEVSDKARERFAREVAAAARLSHPHVVPLFDSGESHGRPYLVMQLIDGVGLDRLCGRDERPAPDTVAGWMVQLADAVAYAHEQGVLHRDLKPQNVLVAGDDAYVVDFGLAKLLDRETALTRTGASLGTPAYMSPEQAAGKSPDERSDVYGLGATLYEALTGRPPFQGASIAELVLKISRGSPTPPREWVPSLPADLELICLKCLERDPALRYQSAAEVRFDLERYLEGSRVLGSLPGPLDRLIQYAERRPRLVLPALGVGLVALAAVIASLFRGAEPVAGTDQALQRARETEQILNDPSPRRALDRLDAYLRRYPDALPNVEGLRLRLERQAVEQDRFREAQLAAPKARRELMRRYLDTFPASIYAEEARRELRALEAEVARELEAVEGHVAAEAWKSAYEAVDRVEALGEDTTELRARVEAAEEAWFSERNGGPATD